MPTTPELPPRPQPPHSAVEALTGWLRWFGPGRLVVGAVSVVIVVGGAAWLLRAPPPTTEASLPVAATGAPPDRTLPPPSTSPGTTSGSPSAGTAAPPSIVVHIAGAVAAPGVHALAPTARVADAVTAAGGAAPDADLDAVNLAAALVDGQRVYVPRLGEVDPASVPSGVPVVDGGGAAGPATPSGPVDLNTATAADLEALPGVGPATATAIVDDRTRNGPFASVDDLDRVSGIGPAKLDALRELVTV
jgi:competence protein ComEA